MKTKTTTKKRSTKLATKGKTATKRTTKRTAKRKKRGLGNVISDSTNSAVATVTKSNPLAIKILVGTAAAGGVFLIGRSIYNKIKKTNKEVKTAAYTKATENLNTKGSQISEAMAQDIANRLLTAMEGISVNVDAIEKAFNDIPNDDASVRAVVKAFGIRNYRFGGQSSKDDKGTPLNLSGWLQEELSGWSTTSLVPLYNIFTKGKKEKVLNNCLERINRALKTN